MDKQVCEALTPNFVIQDRSYMWTESEFLASHPEVEAVLMCRNNCDKKRSGRFEVPFGATKNHYIIKKAVRHASTCNTRQEREDRDPVNVAEIRKRHSLVPDWATIFSDEPWSNAFEPEIAFMERLIKKYKTHLAAYYLYPRIPDDVRFGVEFKKHSKSKADEFKKEYIDAHHSGHLRSAVVEAMKKNLVPTNKGRKSKQETTPDDSITLTETWSERPIEPDWEMTFTDEPSSTAFESEIKFMQLLVKGYESDLVAYRIEPRKPNITFAVQFMTKSKKKVEEFKTTYAAAHHSGHLKPEVVGSMSRSLAGEKAWKKRKKNLAQKTLSGSPPPIKESDIPF